MSNQRNKMSLFSSGLGLVVGAAVGLLAATLANWNIAIAIIVGAVLGLIAGSIVDSLTKKPGK